MFGTRKSLARRAALAALAMLAVRTGGIALAAPTAEVADAAMRGDHDQVLELLEHGADANAAQGDGMTALHWAVTNEDVDTARSLIYAGANVVGIRDRPFDGSLNEIREGVPYILRHRSRSITALVPNPKERE